MNKTELLIKLVAVAIKLVAVAIKLVAVAIWIISGVVGFFPWPGATLQSQWVFGVFFGIGYSSMLIYIGMTIFRFLYRRSLRIRHFADEHGGIPE